MDVIDAVDTVAQGSGPCTSTTPVVRGVARSTRDGSTRGFGSASEQPNGFYILRELVRNRRWFFLFQMISHKMLRWWLCPARDLLPTASRWASSLRTTALALARLAFYGIASLGLTRHLMGR